MLRLESELLLMCCLGASLAMYGSLPALAEEMTDSSARTGGYGYSVATPIPTATPAPGSVKKLRISLDGSTAAKSGALSIAWTGRGNLIFRWSGTTAESYSVVVKQYGVQVGAASVTEAMCAIPATTLQPGSYTLDVLALTGGKLRGSGWVAFTITEPAEATATPQPDAEALTITVDKAAWNAAGWTLAKATGGELSLVWNAVRCDSYTVALLRDGQEALSVSCAESACVLSLDLLEAGVYDVYVLALRGGACVASGGAVLTLSEASGGSGGTPGRTPGRNGRQSKRNLKSAGFTVTPGKALTSSHARSAEEDGVLLYGTVRLSVSSRPMTELTVGGETLAISCGGQSFTARLREGELTLTAGQGRWELSLAALTVLNRSGVSAVILRTGEDEDISETILETDITWHGVAYTKLRQQGLTSSDFLLTVEAGQLRVEAGGQIYRLRAEELVTENALTSSAGGVVQ